MAALSLKGVRKSYGGAQYVLHGIDVDIADGEFVVLVGPSGCGKSTLLRMIAGLETVTEGEIAIGGRIVNALEPKDRDIAMVFQNYALYPHMTVAQNMGYGLKIRGVERALIDARVQAAAPGIAVLGATGSFDASLDEDVAAALRREADATGTALGYRLQA